MASFKKGDVLDISKLKSHKCKLAEISEGTYLTVRALSEAEVREHIADGGDGKEKMVSGHKLIALCAIDDEGKSIFTDEEDVKASLPIGAYTFQDIVKKIIELSGLDKKDREKN